MMHPNAVGGGGLFLFSFLDFYPSSSSSSRCGSLFCILMVCMHAHDDRIPTHRRVDVVLCSEKEGRKKERDWAVYCLLLSPWGMWMMSESATKQHLWLGTSPSLDNQFIHSKFLPFLSCSKLLFLVAASSLFLSLSLSHTHTNMYSSLLYACYFVYCQLLAAAAAAPCN